MCRICPLYWFWMIVAVAGLCSKGQGAKSRSSILNQTEGKNLCQSLLWFKGKKKIQCSWQYKFMTHFGCLLFIKLSWTFCWDSVPQEPVKISRYRAQIMFRCWNENSSGNLTTSDLPLESLWWWHTWQRHSHRYLPRVQPGNCRCFVAYTTVSPDTVTAHHPASTARACSETRQPRNPTRSGVRL